MTANEKNAIKHALELIDCIMRGRGDSKELRYQPREAGWRYRGDQRPPAENALAEARVWLQRALWRGGRE